MRILKISDVYFPRVNGVSTSIQTFAHEMLRQGHEITLIAPEYPTAYDDSFEIVRVPSRFLYVDPEDRMMKRRALRRLLPALRERQFDIVHVHTPFVAHYAGLEAARELGAPVVESYHTYFEEYLGNYLPWLPRAVLRHAARSFSRKQCAAVDALVVPTRPMLEVLRGYGICARAEVVPTGIPGDQFRNGDGARFRHLAHQPARSHRRLQRPHQFPDRVRIPAGRAPDADGALLPDARARGDLLEQDPPRVPQLSIEPAHSRTAFPRRARRLRVESGPLSFRNRVIRNDETCRYLVRSERQDACGQFGAS